MARDSTAGEGAGRERGVWEGGWRAGGLRAKYTAPPFPLAAGVAWKGVRGREGEGGAGGGGGRRWGGGGGCAKKKKKGRKNEKKRG